MALGLLAVTFLAAVGYASTSVYDWARSAAQSLPVVDTADLPKIKLPAPASSAPAPQTVSLPAPVAPKAAAAVDLEVPHSPAESQDRITVLLLGVDQRPDDPSPARTDNIIVVTLEPSTGKLGVISVPRDTLVSIPGFDRKGKINTAYVVGETKKYPGGGGALAKKTVSELLGYPVDYYIKINFDGFERIVDLIGGIDVDVPKTIHDEEYPTIDYGYQTFHIDAGLQHLDGATALKYVRTRHADDDFQRARRQQQVLLAIKDQVLDNKLLATLRVFDLLDVLSGSIEHDLPTSRILELFSLANKVEISEVRQVILDSQYGTIDATSPWGWVVVPDTDRIRPTMQQLFAASTVEQDAPSVNLEALARLRAQQQAELARQQVRNNYQAQAEALRLRLAVEGARIVLYNGTSDPTLAARAADWLRQQGYDIIDSGQADRTDYPRTVAVVHNDKPFTLANLQDAFAIAEDNIRYSATERDVDIHLIIGRDFYLLVSN